MYIFSNMRF